MTKNEYEKLLNECEQSVEEFDGYKVKNYIASPEKNLHVFTILYDNKPMAVGLPWPRSFCESEDPQLPKEIEEWGQYIEDQELFWKPCPNNKLKMAGVFIRISGEKKCGSWEEEANSVEELEIKFRSLKPAEPVLRANRERNNNGPEMQ